MNELLRRYVALTEIDHALVETREQLAQYPALLKRMEMAEADDKKRAEALDADMKATRQSRVSAEKEVLGLRDKVSRFLSQQSTVKTNKEFEAITHEIESAKEKIDEWENQGLELLIREESLLDRRNAGRKKAEMMAREHGEERARVAEQKVEKETRLAKLAGERAEQMTALDEADLDQYELLNEHFPGTACAPLEDESCGACHWHLVASTVQHVHQGTDMVECDHCHRYLYQPGT